MLIMLRHGRTPLNAQGCLQGRIDTELDETGRGQAADAASRIGPVDLVIASPLARARQTAEALGQPVTVDERFVELNYGDWEGRPLAEVPAETWATWREDLDFRPPGGETLNELGIRVRAGLEELAEQADGRNVVVVSHVSPIKAAAAWAMGVDDTVSWRMHLGQAAISRIDFRGGEPILVSFNE